MLAVRLFCRKSKWSITSDCEKEVLNPDRQGAKYSAARYTVIMSAAIKQIVIVRPGGVVEVRSPELHEGDQAEVTVIVTQPANHARANGGAGAWRRHAGTFNSKDKRAGDNQRIDADLAAEYGSRSKTES
jgi:hypothetical protein